MKDNSKKVAIVLAVLAIIVVIISLVTTKGDNKKEGVEPIIVTNASNFYTVNSCLYRTITYLSAKDKDSLNLILNGEYKKENKIKKEDILDLFPNVEQNSTFVSEKMYYEIITSNLTKYYVKGHIEINTIMDDTPLTSKDYDSVYFIVYLNSSDKLFSVEPYDGEIFNEGEVNEG